MNALAVALGPYSSIDLFIAIGSLMSGAFLIALVFSMTTRSPFLIKTVPFFIGLFNLFVGFHFLRIF